MQNQLFWVSVAGLCQEPLHSHVIAEAPIGCLSHHITHELYL